MAKYKWPTQVPVLEAADFRCGGGGKNGIPATKGGIEIEGRRQNCLMEYANIVFCPRKVWDKIHPWDSDTQFDAVPEQVYVAIAEACGCQDLCNNVCLQIIEYNDSVCDMQKNADAWNKAMRALGYTEIHEVVV
jgi:hypothetical protein